MNNMHLSLINLCAVSYSFTVSKVIWFPLHKVRSKCECAHTIRVGMVLVVRPYVHHIYIWSIAFFPEILVFPDTPTQCRT